MDQNRSTPGASLPNILTASRIAAAPLLAFTVLVADAPRLAATLVLLAALTDFFDGALARANRQITSLGAILDPIADKIFVVTALLVLLAEGALKGLSVWAILIIVWRELLISGLRDYTRFLGFPAPVSSLAKVKTGLQFSAVILLFIARVPSLNSEIISDAGTGLLWAAAGFTLYTGADYLWQAWRRAWK